MRNAQQIGDIKGATHHTYALRTHEGTGFWLDDRVDNEPPLPTPLPSSVTVTRMPQGW